MKKCDKCFESEGIIKWEVPESPHDFSHEFMHICTKCGHAAWPDAGHLDTGRPDAEDQVEAVTETLRRR